MNMLNRNEEILAAVRAMIATQDRERDSVEAMANLVAVTSQLSVAKVGAWEQAIRSEIDAEAYYASRARKRILSWRLKSKPRDHRFVTPWIDLCNGDGFRRERVLRATRGGAPNAFLFALLFRRLNDWVPQVRDAARQAVSEVAPQTDPEYLVETIWEIFPHLQTWGRLQDEELQVIGDLFGIEGMSAQFVSRIKTSTSGPGVLRLSQACRVATIDASLPSIAKEAVQPAVRAKAYQYLLEGHVSWVEGKKWTWTDKIYCKGRFAPVIGERTFVRQRPILEILTQAMRDKSPMVRRVAGSALVIQHKTLGEHARLLAEQLSKDPCPSVAERANFVLKQQASK